MSNELIQLATQTAEKLDHLEGERQRLGLESFAILEKLDVELANQAKGVFSNRDAAAAWLTDEIESLGWETPWRCLANGNREQVEYILNAIEYGHPA